MKKYKFRRFGITTGTKVQQANLRALAKDMAEDPGILIPDCIGKCSRCQFEKLRAKLRKIQTFKDNPVALKKLASGGKQLERAYASMLMLAAEDTPIMFATAKLPRGDVGYTVRGKAKKEFLIGLQHFDDPKLRLLAYSEFAIKKKLHVYSSEDELMCSGKGANYPADLVSEVLRTSSYELHNIHPGYQCEHGDKGYGLRLEIISTGLNIEICKSCASRKQNIFTELTSRVLAKHPDDDFIIHLEHDLECIKGEDCTVSKMEIKTSELIDSYRAGKLSDRDLIDEFEVKVRDFLMQTGKPIFVLGNTCYEDDFETFIKTLEPSEIEEIALKRMLKSAPSSVVMDTATPNAVLALFWDTLGATAIFSVIGDKELAKKIYSETKTSGKTPSQVLRDARIQSKSKNVLAALPDFKKLSKIGRYVDELAKTYMAMGKEETLKRIGTLQGDTKIKSIDCGFLTSLGALKGKEWQFTKEEQDYGKYLANFVTALLDSSPEDYSDTLQNLLTASGSGEMVG